MCGFFTIWCRLADPKTSICFLLYNRKNGYFTLFLSVFIYCFQYVFWDFCKNPTQNPTDDVM